MNLTNSLTDRRGLQLLLIVSIYYYHTMTITTIIQAVAITLPHGNMRQYVHIKYIYVKYDY